MGQLGEVPRNPASGNLLLQICSDDLYVCEHVVRRVEQELGNQLLSPAREQLGLDAFDAEWSNGQAMAREDVIAYALARS